MQDVPFAFVIEQPEGGARYKTRPTDIELRYESTGGNTFGTAEVEQVAGRLVLFFQSLGYWRAFTLSELAAFYQEKGWEDYNNMLYGLMGPYAHTGGPVTEFYQPKEVYMVCGPNGKYYITNKFVDQCAGEHLKKKL